MSSSASPNDARMHAEARFAAWAARVEGGEVLDFDELVRAHPALESELRRLHEDWQLFAPILGRAIPGLIADASGLVLPSLARDPDADEVDPPSDDLYARLGIHAPSENRYRFRSVIGRGGGGVVLKVWDSKLNRPLAMKVVLGRDEERPSGHTPKVDGRTLSRFVDEARIASQLNHPGIVPVHELGADETGRAFFTMKLVKGEDLARIFEKVASGEDGWNPARALGVLLRVCEAMAYAHDKGVIHRDLKPANIMVGAYGEVHVMDWGLARVIGEKDRRDLRVRPNSPDGSSASSAGGSSTSARKKPALPLSAVDSFRKGARDESPDSPLVTMDGSVIGTPSYMSPEQARGEIEDIGMRSDVYALGAMLYHLIGGEPPYAPKGARVPQAVVLTNVMHGPPRNVLELAPRASAELVAICEKAMERESTRRYGSMLELASDLRAFIEGRVVSAYETGTWAETRKWVLRNKALAGAVAAALVIAVVGGVLIAIKNEQVTRTANIATQQAGEMVVLKEVAEAKAREAQENAAEAREATHEAARNTYLVGVVGAYAAERANEPAEVRRLLDSAPEEWRNWEWGHLNAQSDRSLLALKNCFTSLQRFDSMFSEDGKRIVTILDQSGGTEGDFAYVWDLPSGLPRSVIRCEPMWTANISPDGRRVVTTGDGGTCARVWDASSGAQLCELDGPDGLSCVFSPDSQRVLMASSDGAHVFNASNGKRIFRLITGTYPGFVTYNRYGTRILTKDNNEIVMWDAHTGAELVRFAIGTVYSVALSPDCKRIVTASANATVDVWDTSNGAPVFELEGHTTDVVDVVFSADGARILSSSRDQTARVWDAADGALLVTLHAHAAVLRSNFSPDGTRIVTISGSTVDVWEVESGVRLFELKGHIEDVWDARFLADGARIVTRSGDGTCRIWDAAREQPAEVEELEGHTAPLRSASFSPDGTRIVTASDDKTARVWDAMSGAQIARLEGHTGGLTSVTFSLDGSRIVTTSGDKTARVWDAASGAQIAKLEGYKHWLTIAGFSADGTRIVTASGDHPAPFLEDFQGIAGRDVKVSGDNSARVWDLVGGAQIAKLEGHSDWLSSATFSPDGTRIVTASCDATARVWDAVSGAPIAKLEGHAKELTSATFSPDGTRVVTTSYDKTARVWNAMSGAQIATLEGHGEGVTIASFGPDGTRIVTAALDGTARVWNASSGEQIAVLGGHRRGVRLSACFMLDMSRIITASHEGEARVWNASSGAQIAKLEGHVYGRVTSASFSSDGTRIVMCSDNNIARIYDSVSYRVRYAERQTVDAARPRAEQLLKDALSLTGDWIASGARIRGDSSLDPLIKHAALDRLTMCANKSLLASHTHASKRAERTWMARMLGREAWPKESDVESSLFAAHRLPDDAGELNWQAWRIVDPDGSVFGDEMRALVLARRAVASAEATGSFLLTSYRDTLARALFRVARFDEAVTEQRRALSEAREDEKEMYQDYLTRLESNIAAWRDESGRVRISEWTAKLEALDREIAAIEQDCDVQLWLAHPR